VASGYNLTILVRAARRALANKSKYLATFAAVGLMIGFLGVTGMSPSMSRAALVTSLSLAAWYYGRAIHPVTLLLVAAAITAGVNPLYVWGDLGWYLSFLAFAGVMLGAPLLQKFFFKERKVPQLAQIGIETLSAELATLPLTLLVFGSVSVVGLLANVLVCPLVPFAMLATFAGGLASLLLPAFGTWLALPAHWILGYIVGVVQWLSEIPWAHEPLSLNWVGMVTAYGALLVAGWLLLWRTRFSYLKTSVVE
jgi:competence protein ComEC